MSGTGQEGLSGTYLIPFRDCFHKTGGVPPERNQVLRSEQRGYAAWLASSESYGESVSARGPRIFGGLFFGKSAYADARADDVQNPLQGISVPLVVGILLLMEFQQALLDAIQFIG